MGIRSKSNMRPLLLPLSILVTYLLTPAAPATLLSNSASTSQALTAIHSSAVVPSATRSPPVKRPNGDPCGPTIQNNPDYPNTCNLVPSLAQAPAPYGINCTQTFDIVKYPKIGVTWDNCAASLQSICTKMEDSRTMTGYWIWSELAAGCALGFFLPSYQGSAPRPSGQRCMNIFTALVNSCRTTTKPSNVGGINLRAYPTYDPDFWVAGGYLTEEYPNNIINATGEAVNAGYPSYMVSSLIRQPE